MLKKQIELNIVLKINTWRSSRPKIRKSQKIVEKNKLTGLPLEILDKLTMVAHLGESWQYEPFSYQSSPHHMDYQIKNADYRGITH